jgi:ketosteroid isomerase-like protein
MNRIQRFAAYAAAFEKAVAENDWAAVEPHFTEDAVYEIFGPPPFAGRHSPRSDVLAYLRASLDGFDRRFDERELEVLEGPVERGDSVWLRWRATYRLAGAPPLAVEGEETATYRGDAILRLEDRFEPNSAAGALAYFGEHAAKLRPPSGG